MNLNCVFGQVMVKPMSTAVKRFYDHYHQKNDRFHAVIQANNFTYYYHFALLAAAGLSDVKGLHILDVGCGVGTMSLYFAAQGAQVTGVDISPRAIAIAQAAAKDIGLHNVTFINGEVQKGRGKYDLVLCSEIVEHVPDESGFLRLIQSNLRKGGTLILTTPSKENLLYRLGYYTSFDAEVGHLRRYTSASIRKAVGDAGLTVKTVRAVEGPLRNILFTSPLGVLIKGIKGPLIPLFHAVDEFTAKLFGAADLQVIAIKE